MKYNIASLFSGAGGLDLGFEQAGFTVDWANEFDKTITPTLRKNFPETEVDDRSITDVNSNDIPETIGVIGGPPCQSWSEAGSGRGLKDRRGEVFFEYIRVIRDKQPLFFLAENVSGMLSKRHEKALTYLIEEFKKLGYSFDYKLLNTKDYGVPQDRKRVIFVGYHKKIGKKFQFPEPFDKKVTLKDVIWDLKDTAQPAKKLNKTNGEVLNFPNHEYMIGGFSTMYMSRNRVRGWDEQSFTIQAGGRHAPIHPQAPKMKFIEQDKRVFVPGKEHLYRRLSVRECARIQTFPDDFKFLYTDVATGYKMIGNAVPVKFAYELAKKIKNDLDEYYKESKI
ncbi:DNA cytosine methyltransferase [Candidatus Micrarchaeota archaeon]|jgi:DNA (cytosine-5)-methyltransferase 1|nr:DNA cytosine methyltransferase [Candidatus Micrarchaeota archaeon]